MNKENIDKWLNEEYGVSYTRLEELHDFVVEQNMKFQDKITNLQEENEFLKDYKIAYENVMTANKMLEKENQKLKEKVNKFNINKINNENKSLKGSCKVLGEKDNNQRKELNRLINENNKLKETNEEHRKINGILRHNEEILHNKNVESQQRIDKAIEYIEMCKQKYDVDGSVEDLNEFSILASPNYLLNVLKGNSDESIH